MSDWSQAAIAAAALLDELEARYDSPDTTVGQVLVLVELDDTVGNDVFVRCSDGRQWVQLGLLQAAIQTVIDDHDGDKDEDES